MFLSNRKTRYFQPVRLNNEKLLNCLEFQGFYCYFITESSKNIIPQQALPIIMSKADFVKLIIPWRFTSHLLRVSCLIPIQIEPNTENNFGIWVNGAIQKVYKSNGRNNSLKRTSATKVMLFFVFFIFVRFSRLSNPPTIIQSILFKLSISDPVYKLSFHNFITLLFILNEFNYLSLTKHWNSSIKSLHVDSHVLSYAVAYIKFRLICMLHIFKENTADTISRTMNFLFNGLHIHTFRCIRNWLPFFWE